MRMATRFRSAESQRTPGCISWDCRGCTTEGPEFYSALETMPLISYPTSPDATQRISWPVRHCETESVESVANDLIQRPLRDILRITLLKRPSVQAFDSRIVRQQRVDRNHLRGHRCAMSALAPTLPPSATSALYPSDLWRAGAYSSVLTHFSIEEIFAEQS